MSIFVGGVSAKDVATLRLADVNLRVDSRSVEDIAIQAGDAPQLPAQDTFFRFVAGKQPGAFTNAFSVLSADESPRTVLLIDLLNTAEDQRRKLRQAVARFLQDSTVRHVAIYALTSRLEVLQDFNGDGIDLREAIEKVQDPNSDDTLAMTAGRGRVIPAPRSTTAAPLEFLESVNDYLKFNQDASSENRADITFSAVDSIARHLSSMPGRKQLIWFSGAFGCGFAAVDSLVVEECSRFRIRAYSTMHHLQAGFVSIYPLTVNASENPHIEESHRIFERPVGRHFFPQADSSRSAEFNKALRIRDLSMQTIVDATGGRLLGKKSLSEAVRAANADSRSGIDLIFSLPQPRSDQSVYTIDLTIRGKSNRLMFPHYIYSSQAIERDDLITEELQDALGSTRELIAEISLAVIKTGDRTADIWVDPRAITITGGGGEEAAIDLDVGTSTLSGAYRPLTTSLFRLQRTVGGSVPLEIRREGLLLHVNFIPHNRARRVRFVVRDRTTGRIGTVDLPLQPFKTTMQ